MISRAIIEVTEAERVYIEAFGEDTLHAHLVLLARTPEIPPDARRGAFLARKAEFVDEEKARDVATRVRQTLSTENIEST
jgi:hypothetical protein